MVIVESNAIVRLAPVSGAMPETTGRRSVPLRAEQIPLPGASSRQSFHSREHEQPHDAQAQLLKTVISAEPKFMPNPAL
jgi:hypothetical protein